MSLYKELEQQLIKNCNSNFHLDRLDWEMQVVLKALCKILDSKLTTIKHVSDNITRKRGGEDETKTR